MSAAEQRVAADTLRSASRAAEHNRSLGSGACMDPTRLESMTDHDQVVEQERAGKLLIGVDRAFARRFYTDVALKTIEERTGEAPYFEKLVVMGAFIGEHLALLGAAVLAVLVTGWWSILLIPAGLIGWFAFS
jgi:hypothetical protein